MPLLAVTVIGPDSPGIITAVTGVLAGLGGNLEDSTMTLLRGHFAMMLLAACAADPADVEGALAPVADRFGLVVSVREVPEEPEAAAEGQHVVLRVHGADRPGIVSAMTRVLADEGGNITDLTTRLTGRLYLLVAEADLPAGVDLSEVQRRLSDRAEELGVDATLHPADEDVLQVDWSGGEIRPVLRAPDRTLSVPARRCDPGDPDVVALARDLVATMRVSPGCVGLAAPQIGVGARVFCADVTGHRKARSCAGLVVLANPRLLAAERPAVAREGCLSVPDLTGDVARATRVVVAGVVPGSGEDVVLDADAFEARAVQHEIDHLDGLLFLDRVTGAHAVFRRKRYQPPRYPPPEPPPQPSRQRQTA